MKELWFYLLGNLLELDLIADDDAIRLLRLFPFQFYARASVRLASQIDHWPRHTLERLYRDGHGEVALVTLVEHGDAQSNGRVRRQIGYDGGRDVSLHFVVLELGERVDVSIGLVELDEKTSQLSSQATLRSVALEVNDGIPGELSRPGVDYSVKPEVLWNQRRLCGQNSKQRSSQ